MPELPVRSVRLDLINACNVRCTFCPYFGKAARIRAAGRKRGTARLDAGLLLENLQRLKRENGRFAVRISGDGEGMLHPQFAGILQGLRSLGLEARLITNGTLLEKHAEAVRACISHLVVSVHGPEKVHDSLVGKPGAFRRVLHGLSLLGAGKEGAPHASLALVANLANVASIIEHIELCEKLGFSARIEHNFLPSANRGIDLGMLGAALAEASSRGASISPQLEGEALRKFYSPGPFVLNPHECGYVKENLSIRSNGDVFVCGSEYFGNLSRSPLDEIARGKERMEFIKRIQQEARSKQGLSPEKCDRCCYQ